MKFVFQEIEDVISYTLQSYSEKNNYFDYTGFAKYAIYSNPSSKIRCFEESSLIHLLSKFEYSNEEIIEYVKSINHYPDPEKDELLMILCVVFKHKTGEVFDKYFEKVSTFGGYSGMFAREISKTRKSFTKL